MTKTHMPLHALELMEQQAARAYDRKMARLHVIKTHGLEIVEVSLSQLAAHRLRKRMERAVEMLIAAMDAIDAQTADMEDDEREPEPWAENYTNHHSPYLEREHHSALLQAQAGRDGEKTQQ
jgi:hypothetical protein